MHTPCNQAVNQNGYVFRGSTVSLMKRFSVNRGGI